MLKGLTSTFKQGCNDVELTYNEYVKLENQIIPIKAQLKDDTYENGNFIGTFILKQITFETEATYEFRNKEFEYYKVVNGESIKIGTFISTDITINDTTEIVKVIGMDYGLKTQVEYTSSLDYASGNITLMDVWNECCELSGLESGIKGFANSDFIVDSDQFTGTGATIRDVFKAIAMSSGTFVKVMNDDKIYLIFNEFTSDIEEVEVDGSATIEDGYKLDDIELQGNTTQEGTPTPDSPQPVNVVSGRQTIDIYKTNLLKNSLEILKTNNTAGTWVDNVYTYNGTTFTCNANGSITVNGSPSANTNFYISRNGANYKNNTYPIGTYYLTSHETTGANSTWKTQFADGTTSYNVFGNGNNKEYTLTLTEQKSLTCYVIVYSGKDPNGATFYPMIAKTSGVDYEQYNGKVYEINLGKNLYDPSFRKEDSSISCGNGTATENNGVFTLTATGTDMYMWNVRSSGQSYTETQGKLYEFEGDTYTVSVSNSLFTKNFVTYYDENKVSLGYNTRNSNKFNFSKSDKAGAKYFAIRIGTSPATIGTSYSFTVQLEKGIEATTYAPYKTPIELCKIGNYHDFIKRGTGKNLFSSAMEIGSINNTTGENATNDNGIRTIGYITVKPNTTYTIWNSRNYNILIHEYGENKNYLQYTGNFNNPKSFTTTANTYYIRVRSATGEVQNNLNTNYMMVLGEYTSQTIPSYEPYGMYNKWYIEKQIGKVVLNGSESWTNATSSGFYRFSTTLDNSHTEYTREICLSNYYKYLSSGHAEGICFVYATKVFLYPEQIITTTDDFKTWLSTHNTIVYYILATPTYTEITDSELIGQLNALRLLEGINNVSVSSADLSSPIKISYYNDDLDIVEDYTELEDKRDTHPWTCLRLGTTQIDGNNLDYIDQELVEEYGENWLILNDNPFAYSMEKRQQLIMNIFNQIKEFGYSAFVSKTSFKPYLTSGDVIRFKNRDGNFVKTILLRYNHNGEEIELSAPSETSATINYIRPLNESQQIKNLQIIVDQDKEQITSIVETTNAQSTSINNLTSMVNSQGESIDALGTRLTQTTDSITASVSAIQGEIDDGVGLVKTASATLDDDGLSISTDTSKIKTTMTNNSFEIKDSGDNKLAFFGYDETEGISKAEMNNLTVTNYFVAGVHRIESYTEDGEQRTGWFYIGG